MAEIRKFDPGDGDGIQKLVREALGENIRPVNPWELKPSTADQPAAGQPAAGDLTASTLPETYSYTFSVVEDDESDQSS